MNKCKKEDKNWEGGKNEAQRRKMRHNGNIYGAFIRNQVVFKSLYKHQLIVSLKYPLEIVQLSSIINDKNESEVW